MSREVFVSYAREDAAWRDEFVQMLAPAQERGLIRVWSDDRIAAGEEWSRSIKQALERAKVGLLLVSAHFLRSRFINDEELATLLSAARTRRVSIRWVPVSSSLYKYSPLNDLQACGNPEQPLDMLPEAERRAEIKKICDEIVEEFGVEPTVSAGRREALGQRVQERLGDRYALDDVVGSGKFSLVYRAQQTQPKRAVGVKVVVASELDDWARRLFIDGVERANALQSPAFIRIFEAFMDDVPEFLVMEFIEGEPLARVLRHHAHGLPLDRVKHVLLDLATAIEEAHARGFRRGEMCPSDILIESSGRPRLPPFDFTNVLREEAQVTSDFLLDRESLAYMTPERYFGEEPTERTDQYSLGLIATELLGGARMPAVRRPCDLEVKRSLFARLESGQGDWAKRSAQFAGVVRKMLQIDPERRWPSMSVVRSLLSEVDVGDAVEEARRRMAIASYVRIQGLGADGERRFFETFYDNLLSALPDVRTHFASVDMKRQHHVLNDAIHALLDFREDLDQEKATLAALAARHAKFGLTQRHYSSFLEALVQTLSGFGEGAPAVLEAWRSTVAPGLEFMRTRQQQDSPGPPASATNP